MLKIQQMEKIMKKYFSVLRRCPLFEQIADSDLERMLGCLGAKTEFFDKKYTIMSEGNPAKYIGIVLSGSVHVVQVDYFGNRSIISAVEESQVFGEAFACAETDSLPVSVIANEPCEIMLIECSHIMHTCTNNCGFHQKLIFNLMKDLATKAILFHRKLEVTSKRTTREKLLTFLNLESKRHSGNSFYIPFDRQELADYLEVDRSGLSAEIGKLRHEGIIENRKNYFRLL